jgi:hypothetical protein
MSKDLELNLGTYRGRDYLLRGEAIPGLNDPEEFAVVLYYKDANSEENVQIARVDMAHGYTHIDRLYKRGEPKDPVDWDFWEAMNQLERN